MSKIWVFLKRKIVYNKRQHMNGMRLSQFYKGGN